MKNKIRELRTAKKLRQEDLASLVGVTRQTINAIENDKYDPTLALLGYLKPQLMNSLNIVKR